MVSEGSGGESALSAERTIILDWRCHGRSAMSADLLDQLRTTLGDAYTFERELGGGGMSRVFLAIETSLGRRVVLKVLSPDLAAGVSAQRFSREVRLAASLQQANIVPVLSTGETNGLPYYTMPFVDGLSLHERLMREGSLSLDTAIGVLRDVARALAYAHEHGVVHRDIKPQNVLLSGDAAVVTDFGIAKAISEARGDESRHAPGSTTFTLAGTSLGTPAYMAPEQIAADPALDHRADLYAFGCLAYEVIAGEPPFSGYPLQKLLAAHLGESPVSLGARRHDCPPAIVALVMQCLEKAPEARPQSAREILRSLQASTTSATAFDRLRNRFDRRRWLRAAVAATAIVLIALAGRGLLGDDAGGARIESLAVIPFANAGRDTAQDYLAEGIANELTTALGKVAGLRVVSRALTARYGGRLAFNAQEIGRDLDVRYVLHGTVRKSGERLSISAQLIDALDNSETWSEDFSRVTDNLFEVQDSITRAVGSTLGVPAVSNVASGGTPSAAQRGTANRQAYDLYLRGKLALERRGRGVTQAVERFEQAIALDTNFSRAHASLAVALGLLPVFTATSSVEVRERVLAAAQRALALDSTQAEAYTALGMAHRDANEWEQSLAAHRQSILLDSIDAHARVQYGRTLYHLRRYAAASAEFERARALDPYSAVASAWAGHLLSVLGRNDEAIVELQRALEIDSLNPPGLYMMAAALLKAGHRDSAKRIMERMVRSFPAWRPAAGILYARLGERDVAEAAMRQAASAPAAVAGRYTTIAMIALALRDSARALDALERATDAREPWVAWGAVGERHFDPVLGTARFSALLLRVGLDERTWTSSAERPR